MGERNSTSDHWLRNSTPADAISVLNVQENLKFILLRFLIFRTVSRLLLNHTFINRYSISDISASHFLRLSLLCCKSAYNFERDWESMLITDAKLKFFDHYLVHFLHNIKTRYKFNFTKRFQRLLHQFTSVVLSVWTWRLLYFELFNVWDTLLPVMFFLKTLDSPYSFVTKFTPYYLNVELLLNFKNACYII